jgi:hypothetical protein
LNVPSKEFGGRHIMIEFLSNNLATIVVGLILLAIVIAIVYSMVKNKKNGKSNCGCGCEHCASSAVCHGTKKREK